MAKKKDQSFRDLFKATEQPKAEQPEEPKTKVKGIYFSDEEQAKINSVMDATGATFYGVVKMALSYFLNHYEAGKIATTQETKTKLDIG